MQVDVLNAIMQKNNGQITRRQAEAAGINPQLLSALTRLSEYADIFKVKSKIRVYMEVLL